MTRANKQLNLIDPSFSTTTAGLSPPLAPPPPFTALDIQHARNTDLEQATGIASSYFSAWERGRKPSRESILIISSALSMEESEVALGLDLRRVVTSYAIGVREKFKDLIIEQRSVLKD